MSVYIVLTHTIKESTKIDNIIQTNFKARDVRIQGKPQIVSNLISIPATYLLFAGNH